MVVERLARKSLKCVYPAEAHIDLFVTKLFHGAREALSDLPLAVQRESARRVDDTYSGERASQNCKQRGADTPEFLGPIVTLETSSRR
jgi:hypothetical protein